MGKDFSRKGLFWIDRTKSIVDRTKMYLADQYDRTPKFPYN